MLFIIEEDKNNIIKPKKKFIEHANPITWTIERREILVWI
jgi:hypothetical protein